MTKSFPFLCNKILLALQSSLEDENSEAPAQFCVTTTRWRRWGKRSHRQDTEGPAPSPSSDLLNDLSFQPLRISVSLIANWWCIYKALQNLQTKQPSKAQTHTSAIKHVWSATVAIKLKAEYFFSLPNIDLSLLTIIFNIIVIQGITTTISKTSSYRPSDP